MNPKFIEITGPNDHVPHPNPDWERDGVLLLPKLIPDDLINAYVEERTRVLGGSSKWRTGWNGPTPYLQIESMKALATYRSLTEKIRYLIGAEPGLHLCLTGFQSTERRTHQDRYLNPENVGEKYIAAWIALDDVHHDAGPFEWVPGSHRWPVIERSKVWDQMRNLGQNPSLPTWPSDSQEWVGDACDDEVALRGKDFVPFLAKKGDVLLWHASLLHRGSKPKNKALERRALIAHYSSIHARPDMPHLVPMENGSHYFNFPGSDEPEDSTHQAKMT